jgi:hypothetical protein
MDGEVISDERLTTIFVYSLEDLGLVRMVLGGIGVDCLTLYPAAYPSPGKREKNLRGIECWAYSLKMTELRFEEEVIWRN